MISSIQKAYRAGWRRVAGTLGVSGLIVAALAFFAAPNIAFAHASYVSSDPPANGVVKTAPSVVTVHFAEHVNPNGSAIVIYDAKGNTVSTAPAQVVQSDLKTMTVPMKGDGSDVYLVQWHTVSADDGDPDVGGFTFTVNANASSTGTSTTTPATTTSSSSSSGVPGWVVALIGVLGLVIGAGAGIAFARRTPPAPAAAPAARPQDPIER